MIVKEFSKVLVICNLYPIEEIVICGVEEGHNGKSYLMFQDGETLTEKFSNARKSIDMFKIILPELEFNVDSIHWDI